MLPGPISLFLFVLACATSCYPQATTFQWQFANNFVSASLGVCQNMSIVVKSYQNDEVTFGVPPYYFRAFPIGGIPTLALAGSDRNALSWRVDQAVGSRLMLSMLDSNGSSGGMAPTLYDVIPGNDTSCLPSPPTSQFTVHANISTTLQTCQPWGMTIKGGLQPYVVSLATLDSPVVTNVTLGPLDDVFTYIDRADPNTQLVAAVSDANGRYANGTALVSTKGSTNVNCTGLVSLSGNSTQIAAQAAAQAAADARRSRSHRRTSIIIGVVVTTVVLILIGCLISWFSSRKRKEELGIMVGQDTMPRMFEVEQAIPVAVSSSRGESTSSRKALLSLAAATLATPESSGTPLPSSLATGGPSSASQSTPGQAHASSQSPENSAATDAAGTSSPPRRPNKAVAAYMRATRVLNPNRNRNRGASAPHDSLDPDMEPDIIIQHRDGGVVQELPPPYADRSSAPRRS